VRNGQPATITLGSPISALFADGVLCKLPVALAVPIQSSGYSTAWPLSAQPDQPFQCTKGPPTTLRFEFSSEFGRLISEFAWTGSNVTVDIELPALQLPRTGGSPGP
jgi:hypothetical protein